MRCKGDLVVLRGKTGVPYLKVHFLPMDDKWEMLVVAQSPTRGTAHRAVPVH
jgi:hypothetical protein